MRELRIGFALLVLTARRSAQPHASARPLGRTQGRVEQRHRRTGFNGGVAAGAQGHRGAPRPTICKKSRRLTPLPLTIPFLLTARLLIYLYDTHCMKKFHTMHAFSVPTDG